MINRRGVITSRTDQEKVNGSHSMSETHNKGSRCEQARLNTKDGPILPREMRSVLLFTAINCINFCYVIPVNSKNFLYPLFQRKPQALFVFTPSNYQN